MCVLGPVPKFQFKTSRITPKRGKTYKIDISKKCQRLLNRFGFMDWVSVEVPVASR